MRNDAERSRTAAAPAWHALPPARCRRLSKDLEKSVLSSEAFIKLAMIQLMLICLEPSEADTEFHYRDVA